MNLERLLKESKPIKISAHLNNLKESRLAKKKMERGRKILAKAGVAKIPGR